MKRKRRLNPPEGEVLERIREDEKERVMQRLRDVPRNLTIMSGIYRVSKKGKYETTLQTILSKKAMRWRGRVFRVLDVMSWLLIGAMILLILFILFILVGGIMDIHRGI